MFQLTLNADSFTRQVQRLTIDLTTQKNDRIVKRYFQQLQRIAADATALGRIQIKLATTPTGRARAGDPGRIVSEKFYKGLKWKVTKEDTGEYRVAIGWLDGQPDWAVYQELGFQHRSGMYVTGADALGEARRYAENEISRLR